MRAIMTHWDFQQRADDDDDESNTTVVTPTADVLTAGATTAAVTEYQEEEEELAGRLLVAGQTAAAPLCHDEIVKVAQRNELCGAKRQRRDCWEFNLKLICAR